MASFEELTRVRDGAWTVPDGWQQGRGAFGGLSLATAARHAMVALGDPSRTLRSITAEIPAAVLVGEAHVRAEVLRHGGGMSAVAARVEQGGSVVVHAVCTFGKPRPTDMDRTDLASPSLPALTTLSPMPSGVAPTFTQHLEYWPIGGLPFSGAKEPIATGYVRLRDPGDLDPLVALVALADAWWPAVMPTATSLRPFGTISFSAQLFSRPFSLAEPLYHRAHNIAGHEGFFVEQRELWTLRGELVAINHQTLALIK